VSMNKLLLVDGSALLHRAYHAYPPLRSKRGVIVGAVYGVASMLVTALVEQEPEQVVVAWDLPKPTFRHEMYIGYKAQRKKADTEMVEQIPLVKEMVEAMGLVQMEQEGYEADDIIGTLSVMSEDEVIVLTGDQDLMQLVKSNVKILLPPRGKIPAKLFGSEEVLEKYGVTPEQFVDYKALMGDPSDNIPGVRGIGPKTAVKLIQDYETLDDVYQAVNPNNQVLNPKQIKNPKLVEKLLNGEESAKLSYDLSLIECGMPLEVEWESLEYEGLEKEGLKEKLDEYNFRSLIRRIWRDEGKKKVEDERQMGMF
jgi:DNA polymerase I